MHLDFHVLGGLHHQCQKRLVPLPLASETLSQFLLVDKFEWFDFTDIANTGIITNQTTLNDINCLMPKFKIEALDNSLEIGK